MASFTELVAGPNIRDDDEGLFSRDINGQLVRFDAPTEADYKKRVTLQIDGAPVTVPLAEPLKDAGASDEIRKYDRGHARPLYAALPQTKKPVEPRVRPALGSMVGVAGFELATPCTPCKCATRLRYTPSPQL